MYDCDYGYDAEWTEPELYDEETEVEDTMYQDAVAPTYDVDTYDEILATDADARKQLNDLRLSRG